MVEFVSYDGKWPNLCRGELILRINGKEVNLGNCLESGGSAYFTHNYSESHVTHGEWHVDLQNEYEEFREEIEECVNDNIPYGCCGGCL